MTSVLVNNVCRNLNENSLPSTCLLSNMVKWFIFKAKTKHDLITSTTLVTSFIMHKRDGTFEKSFATLSPSFVLMFK